MNIYMTNDYAADQLFWPNVVRATGQALMFAPLSAVATAGIEAENAGSASALFNMIRNLGEAFCKYSIALRIAPRAANQPIGCSCTNPSVGGDMILFRSRRPSD
jgi:hypothetical protein